MVYVQTLHTMQLFFIWVYAQTLHIIELFLLFGFMFKLCIEWSQWEEWSACRRRRGEDCDGERTRTRLCNGTPGATGCEGSDIEIEAQGSKDLNRKK